MIPGHRSWQPEERSVAIKKALLGSIWLLSSIHRFIDAGSWLPIHWLARQLAGWLLLAEGIGRTSNTLELEGAQRIIQLID